MRAVEKPQHEPGPDAYGERRRLERVRESRQGTQILLVDDNPTFRTFVRLLLERAGFSVDEAANGDEALAAAHANPPNLVLLDVCLPGSSGYEVLRELHETVDRDLPVVLVSGRRTDKEDVVSALLLGSDDYLVKPFDPDELLARVRRSLHRGRPRASMRETAARSDLGVLTARELEVLELLSDGLSQSDIALRLVVSPRTVGTHIQHILTKLDVHSRAQAVGMALRSGAFAQ
jgi:DNA-binding NarL/FixJ family response regulator